MDSLLHTIAVVLLEPAAEPVTAGDGAFERSKTIDDSTDAAAAFERTTTDAAAFQRKAFERKTTVAAAAFHIG